MFLFIQGCIQKRYDIITCLAGHHYGNRFDYNELKLIEDDFLKDPIVAVHCKAGKGRTGLIICCYLLYTEQFPTVEQAIEHYDETRTKNKKALTISSQIRQVYHFKHFLDRTCVENAHQGVGARSGTNNKNYVLNSLKNYKLVKAELDMMENCEEYQYKNSLNMFSLTLGPFEKQAKPGKINHAKSQNKQGEEEMLSDDEKSQELNLEEMMKGLNEEDDPYINQLDTLPNEQDND